MCKRPGKHPETGEPIACRKCKQCRENRINDWVGRCIAESKTNPHCDILTLTYGRDENGNEDHPRAKVLTYSDVQKYFKLLRRHGYKLRYFVVGEYGSEKGRSHWHLVIYWLNGAPPKAGTDYHGNWEDDWGNEKRFNHQRVDKNGKPVFLEDGKPAYWWSHGFTQFEEVNPASIRYNTKYIQKDIGKAERQGHLAMSKKPPLGTEYFHREAERYVAQGLAPQDLGYTFDEARYRDGTKIRFWLRGKTADEFQRHFVETWQTEKPAREIPASELIDRWRDKQVEKELEEVRRQKEPMYVHLQNTRRPPPAKYAEWMDSSLLQWDEIEELWFVVTQTKEGFLRWYWRGTSWQVVRLGEKPPRLVEPVKQQLDAQVEQQYRQQTGRE